MRDENQRQTQRLAVLIDADNARADLIEALLKEIAKYGTAHVKRVYGDWTDTQLSKWKEKLNKFAIQPMQQFRYTKGKNATDSALIIDAMDLLYTKNFDGFCIVSSDSDFTRLASRIRESGLTVYGFGENKTPDAFVQACDRFIYTELLGQEDDLAEESSAEPKLEIKPVVKGNGISQSPGKPLLLKNHELVKLLRDAYDATAEDDGWSNLGPFGSQLTKLSPSFDSRTYGYKQLRGLIEATQLFEVKHTAKGIHIKLKDS